MLYKKVLVPLDGSELAECVFPHVESIAASNPEADMFLVRVVEPQHWPTGSGSDAIIFSAEKATEIRTRADQYNKNVAKEYLEKVALRFKRNNKVPQSEVLDGKAADQLVEYSKKMGIDLVVIATHGRSGASRWIMGSIADRVLHSSAAAVLMIRSPGCPAPK